MEKRQKILFFYDIKRIWHKQKEKKKKGTGRNENIEVRKEARKKTLILSVLKLE